SRAGPRRRRRHSYPAGAVLHRARRPPRESRSVEPGRSLLGGRGCLDRKFGDGEELEHFPTVFDRRARADELEHLLATLHLAYEDRADELVLQEEEPLVVARLVFH